MGLEFEDDDVEDDQKYKNEKFHDLLMTKIYGDWRRDEDGQFVKAFNMRNQKKQAADKWIDLFLTKISTKNKHEKTQEQRERRKQGLALKRQEKAEVLNRILSSDPNYGLHTQRYHDPTQGVRERKLLVSSKQQQTDLIVPFQPNLSAPKMGKSRHRSGSLHGHVMMHDRDLDLVGFVAEN